jgi:hypothetical protein
MFPVEEGHALPHRSFIFNSAATFCIIEVPRGAHGFQFLNNNYFDALHLPALSIRKNSLSNFYLCKRQQSYVLV